MLVHNPFYDLATLNLYMARNWRHALDHNNMRSIITACARLQPIKKYSIGLVH